MLPTEQQSREADTEGHLHPVQLVSYAKTGSWAQLRRGAQPSSVASPKSISPISPVVLNNHLLPSLGHT